MIRIKIPNNKMEPKTTKITENGNKWVGFKYTKFISKNKITIFNIIKAYNKILVPLG